MVRKTFIRLSLALLVTNALIAFFWISILWSLVVIGPLILLGMYDLIQNKHTLLRIYPIIGHGRYMMELIRPEIQQYFVESNTDGMPFSREMRSIVYSRSKGQIETIPFGTQRDIYQEGYEWVDHAMDAKPPLKEEPKVIVGQSTCKKPYHSSFLNISAMSFGSLGKAAILALNEGAKQGGFAHNTGEGGISPYHTNPGGDLIWQIGTGYFGCRNQDGKFDPGQFKEKAQMDQVKMIEIKISQGAKPSHGGILPGTKVTEEISQTRGVPLGQDVISPPIHTAFSTPIELMEWLAKLRDLSGGKPIGFKLCLGKKSQFLSLCKAMLETQIAPDFITIDGNEGGTGAAPLEFTNWVGRSMRDGLVYVNGALTAIGLRKQIKIIAAGKMITGFHMMKAIALGADLCNSARGMMFALGCIQARRCHTNDCPTGVATQDPMRNASLDIEQKAKRVAKYHGATIKSFLELVAAAGLNHPNQINPKMINRQIDASTIKHFGEIYYFPEPQALLEKKPPPYYAEDWPLAHAQSF